MSRNFKIIIFLSSSFVLWIFLAPLLAENLIVEKPLDKADAILVLSGSSVYKSRNRRAAEIYRAGTARKILLTDDGEIAGWSPFEEKNPKFVDLARRELTTRGVAPEDIEILAPKVSGTIYEAEALREHLRGRSSQAILIVTSAYHTKRSFRTFRKVLDEKHRLGIVSTVTDEETPASGFWWLSFRGWKWVAGEYLKYFYYWLFY